MNSLLLLLRLVLKNTPALQPLTTPGRQLSSALYNESVQKEAVW